jgi:hypothetical protein
MSSHRSKKRSRRELGNRTNRTNQGAGVVKTPKSGNFTLENIISNFDQIEEARFEVANFKINLYQLVDYFHELN